MRKFVALRWPTIDRVLVAMPPDDSHPQPGDRIIVTGEEYQVVQTWTPAELEIKVQRVK